MAKKFIINNGKMAFSASVEFHRELCKDTREVTGGGYWEWDKEAKTILLYGRSEDFGQCSKEAILRAKQETYFTSYWNGCTVYYSQQDLLELAQRDKVEIFKVEIISWRYGYNSKREKTHFYIVYLDKNQYRNSIYVPFEQLLDKDALFEYMQKNHAAKCLEK